MHTRSWLDRAVAQDRAYRHQLAQELLAHRRLPACADPHAPGHVVEFLKSGKHLCGVLLRRGSRADVVLGADGKDDDEDDLKQALLYTSYAATTAREIEDKSRRYWLLRYLGGHCGDEIAAVVLEPQRDGYLVELTETRLRAFCLVTTKPALAPGARAGVRITGVIPRADVLQLQLAGRE